MISKEADWYYLKVPGVILRSQNQELLWPSLFTALIVYRQELAQARTEGQVVEFLCVE